MRNKSAIGAQNLFVNVPLCESETRFSQNLSSVESRECCKINSVLLMSIKDISDI